MHFEASQELISNIQCRRVITSCEGGKPCWEEDTGRILDREDSRTGMEITT